MEVYQFKDIAVFGDRVAVCMYALLCRIVVGIYRKSINFVLRWGVKYHVLPFSL